MTSFERKNKQRKDTRKTFIPVGQPTLQFAMHSQHARYYGQNRSQLWIPDIEHKLGSETGKMDHFDLYNLGLETETLKQWLSG
jgi:hypothetical protein